MDLQISFYVVGINNNSAKLTAGSGLVIWKLRITRKLTNRHFERLLYTENVNKMNQIRLYLLRAKILEDNGDFKAKNSVNVDLLIW